MGNVRSSALENGVLIGGALGSFGAGWISWYFYNQMFKVFSIVRQLAPEDIELLMSIERLKASGDKALLVWIIIGIALLAIGIGREAYQRRPDS